MIGTHPGSLGPRGPACLPERDADEPTPTSPSTPSPGAQHPFRGSYRELWEASEARNVALSEELRLLRERVRSQGLVVPVPCGSLPGTKVGLALLVLGAVLQFVAFVGRLHALSR